VYVLLAALLLVRFPCDWQILNIYIALFRQLRSRRTEWNWQLYIKRSTRNDGISLR